MVGLYIRLSRPDDDLDEYRQISNSVENQRKILNEYLEKAADLRDEEREEFVDDGWSGTNFQRPAFRRMLALIKQRTVTTVIVKDFSRFGRNYVECADYLEKLFPFLGTRFISVNDDYDSGRTDEDRQTEVAMKNIVNSYYSQDLSRKITSTFDMKRKNGEYFFHPPFGYVKDAAHPGRVLIDEQAAAVVRRIFSLACSGSRQCDIAKTLNRECVPTKEEYNRTHAVEGKEKFSEKNEYAAWTGTKVRRILTDEQYTGIYIGRKSRRAVVGMRKSVKVEDTERIQDNHPAIVDRETFEAAQRIFTKGTIKEGEEKGYPLRSKVICGNCGYSMLYRDRTSEKGCFFCGYMAQTGNRAGCSEERFSEDGINELVFNQLRRRIILKNERGSADEAKQKRREELRLLADEKERLRDELNERQKQKRELYINYSEKRIEKEAFTEQKEKLAAKINSIKAKQEELQKRENKLHKPKFEELEESTAFFEHEKQLTRKMAEVFVEKVVIYDNCHMEIVWKCKDSLEEPLAAAETDEMQITR